MELGGYLLNNVRSEIGPENEVVRKFVRFEKIQRLWTLISDHMDAFWSTCRHWSLRNDLGALTYLVARNRDISSLDETCSLRKRCA